MSIYETIKAGVLGIALAGGLLGSGGAGYSLYEKIQDTPSKSLQEVSESVVQLTIAGDGFCSGTLIQDPDLSDGDQVTILTAKHCTLTLDGKNVTVPYKGQDYEFKLLSQSEDSDLALLQAVEGTPEGLKNAYKVPISLSSNYKYEAYAIGYPMGLSQTITEGFIGALETQAAFSDISKSTTFLRSSVLIAPGNSGGALIQKVDGEYRLVGVATGINPKYFFITFWSDPVEINQFLEKSHG